MNRPNRDRSGLRAVLAVLAASVPLSLAAPADAAEVFKCTSASGKVEFTDAPCGSKQSSVVVDTRPNTLDNSAVREQLLKIENRSLQEKLAAAQAAQAVSATPTEAPAADASRSGSAACRSAQRDLEFATSSVDRNRALIQARQSAMYVACGVREPDRQITNVNVGQRGHRGPVHPVEPRTATP